MMVGAHEGWERGRAGAMDAAAVGLQQQVHTVGVLGKSNQGHGAGAVRHIGLLLAARHMVFDLVDLHFQLSNTTAQAAPFLPKRP